MRPLRPGEEIVLSSDDGAVDCRVIAAAGRYVLLQPIGELGLAFFCGRSSLTFLDGMVPMGWDGTVEAGSRDGELRFCVDAVAVGADRRGSVRLPLVTPVVATPAAGAPIHGQTVDVSAGGLRFRHAGRLEGRPRLRVRCELPGGLSVDADAVVRTVEPGVASVEFVDLDPAQARRIGEWTVNVLRAHLRASG
jgi:hypothetical protein